MADYTLYGMLNSGNCYKPRLLMSHLGLSWNWVETDILKGESRTPDFLQRSPIGKVPVLHLPDGSYLAESNAMLCYFAEGTPYLPQDRLEKARVLQWLFFEQYSHEPYIATSRYWRHILGQPELYVDKLTEKAPGAQAALGVLEGHLRTQDWLVGGRYSVADIALNAYTHVAPEAGFPLESYPAIQAWLARVTEQPGWFPMMTQPPLEHRPD